MRVARDVGDAVPELRSSGLVSPRTSAASAARGLPGRTVSWKQSLAPALVLSAPRVAALVRGPRAELALIREYRHTAHRGRTGFTCYGEPGVGKTRFLTEIAESRGRRR